MRMSRLFARAFVAMVILFVIIAITLSVYSAWNLHRHLTHEYETKGIAIARSIADSSVEILLNRDASTIQAGIDQFTEIDGVSYVFVIDSEGQVISHTFVPCIPDGITELKSETSAIRKVHIKDMGDVIDIPAPILAGVAGYVHVGMDRGLIRSSIWSAIMQQQVLMLLLFLGSAGVAYVLINRISRPLTALTQHVQQLASRDFVSEEAALTPVDTRTFTAAPAQLGATAQDKGEVGRDEIQELTFAFDGMVAELRRYIHELTMATKAKEAVESELRIARQIQESLLPRVFPPFPHRQEFSLWAANIPAKDVAGDFYDFFFIDETRLALIIADVSGKGIPAALFMAVTRTLMKTVCQKGVGPAEALQSANAILSEDNDACMFTTLFLAIYDVNTGRIDYANAGHNAPIIVSKDGQSRFIETGNVPLGVVADYEFTESSTCLNIGDLFMLYTDGVTEATAPDGALYGEDRFVEILAQDASGTLMALSQQIEQELMIFQADHQEDDITMLFLRRHA